MKSIYFKSLEINDIGPLSRVDYKFPFRSQLPRPVVFVGSNGSGKSILLSHLLNPLLTAQQVAFDDAEVEPNRVYKLRSPSYIKSGSNYSYSKVCFGDDFECEEWQLQVSRAEHERRFGCPSKPSFQEIPESGTSLYKPSYYSQTETVTDVFRQNCVLFFPPNRFEQPAWLNERNLKSVAEFPDKPNVSRLSNRRIIQDAPLSITKNWLLDILLDRATYGMRFMQTLIPLDQSYAQGQLFLGFDGDAENLWRSITRSVKLVLGTVEDVRFGVGPRHNRSVAVMAGEHREIVPNIFQLSTGQTSVLNFLLSILRDFDMTGGHFTTIDDVTGVVIIDEIDAHLHAEFQCNILPEFIKLFPKVQFIVTSHSPLFLLGMKKHLGADGFDIVALPSVRKIDVEEFEEFQSVYDHYSTSHLFRKTIETEVRASQRPAVFVEGDYDIRYLRKASCLLSRESTLQRIELFDGEGWGNLDKVWRSCDGPIGHAVPRQVLLLYDCDVGKANQDNARAKKRIIPTIKDNPIQKGIENLFPSGTILSLRTEQPQFFDITPSITRVIRGVGTVNSEVCDVNRSEKSNMCNWLCLNGTLHDFAGFASIFNLIDELFPANDSIELFSKIELSSAGTEEKNFVDLPSEATFQITVDPEIPLQKSNQIVATTLSNLNFEFPVQPSNDYPNEPANQGDCHVTIPSPEALDKPL